MASATLDPATRHHRPLAGTKLDCLVTVTEVGYELFDKVLSQVLVMTLYYCADNLRLFCDLALKKYMSLSIIASSKPAFHSNESSIRCSKAGNLFKSCNARYIKENTASCWDTVVTPLSLSLSILTAIFPVEPVLAGFY